MFSTNEEMRVIIIDDNQADAGLIQLMLNNEPGIQFDFARSFEEFAIMFATGKYVAVLSDINLSSRDGFDVIDFVRSNDAFLPVIIVSGAIGEERAVEFLKRGATDYVLKENLHKLPIAFSRAMTEARLRKKELFFQSQLLKSESRYRSLVENMKEAVILTDAEGVLLFMNHQFCDLSGYSHSELIGKNGYELLIPADLRATVRGKVQDRREGKSDSYETEMLNKAGIRLQVSISATPVTELGRFVGVMSVISDVTREKKQGQLLLRLFEGLSVSSGSKFFSDVTDFITRTFQVKYAVICIYSPDENTARTISFRENGTELEGMAYNTKGTPCEVTAANNRCFYEKNVAVEFPDDVWLKSAGIEAYDGRLTRDSEGNVVGLVILMNDKPMPDDDNRNFILDLVSVRIGQEITSHLAREELKKSESRFRMLIENSVDLNCIVDGHGNFLYTSPNVERILGYTELEMKDIVSFDLFGFGEREQAMELSRRMFQNPGESYDVTHKYLTKHKGYRIFHSRGRSVLREDGTIVQVLNSTDVTENAQLEKELRKSYEILNLVNALVVVVNQKCEVTYVSPSCEAMLGFRREELLGNNWWIKTTKSDGEASEEREKVVKILSQGLADSHTYYERMVMRKEGTPIWMGWEKSMSPDGSLIGVGYNITERKESENALIQSEEKFRKIFESINDVYYQTNSDAVVTMVSPSIELVTGYLPDEIIGRPIVEFFEDESDRDKSRELLLKEGRINNYETTIIGKKLQRIYVSANVSIRFDENGEFAGTQGVFRDITPKKIGELEREALMKELSDRYNEMMQFNYIVSHNLRAPIAQILGLTNLLQFNLDDKEKQKVIDSLVTSTRSLDELIKDLNMILSARSTISQRIEKIDLVEISESVRNSLKHQIEESCARISCESDIESRHVNSIRTYLQSIIYNLVNNAIKYRSPDRIPLIKIKSWREGDYVYIEVADNGIGIDLNLHKDQLFKLYQRFDNTTEGKGLGLYMTRTQVEALGGKIEVHSEKGKGTVFTIRLGVISVENEPTVNPAN